MLVYELWNGTPLSLNPFFSLKKTTSNPYFPIEMSCFISSKKCVFKFIKNYGFKIIKKKKVNILKTSND